jgi:hypothetical protein
VPIDWNGLAYARSQMGISLAFHIVFAAAAVALPALMVIADITHRRTRDPEYLLLSKQLAKGTSILFAVGAVTGTVLSFELGLLWPTFMESAGHIIGMPFSLEGFAFFLEAIFLGLYLYGWQKLSPWAHAFAGVMVSIAGALSGAFVVTANAWMNTPAGFRLVEGKMVDVDPFAAMFNPAAGAQVVHMLLAAYAAVGVGVAGIHGQGNAHIDQYLGLKDVQVTYLIDPDTTKSAAGAKRVEGRQTTKPKTVQDVRQALDDKELDAISIATPICPRSTSTSACTVRPSFTLPTSRTPRRPTSSKSASAAGTATGRVRRWRASAGRRSSR